MSRLVEDPAAAYIVAHRENEDRVPLDCGHLAQPNYFLVSGWERYEHTPGQGVSGTPGYGTDPDTGRKLCYSCIHAAEVEDLRTADRFLAYVSRDHRTVTNWPGGVLGTITDYSEGNNHRRYVKVRDVHGAMWHGSGPSETGDYVNLHRSKT